MSAEQVTVAMSSINEKKTAKQASASSSSGAGGILLSLGLLGVSVAVAAVVYVQVEKLSEDIRNVLGKEKVTLPRDCYDIQTQGQTRSGLYTVYPSNMRKGISVYCDMDKDGGGWLVFQQRQDGSVNFHIDWNSYRFGFGDMNTEFWLGNENLNQITKQGFYELRIELEDFEGEQRYAKYRVFSVAGSETGFLLSVGGYSGDSGDSFSGHDGMRFSTFDRDNDQAEGQCAAVFKGGWWYSNCLSACLNGLYHQGEHESKADGINWDAWKGLNYSMKKSKMMIRPL